MTLTDEEKINYIKNNYHQCFDLELNQSLKTTETVNLIINIEEDLFLENTTSTFSSNTTYKEDYSYLDILKKYNKTDISPTTLCYCKKIKDGDTLVVLIPYQKPSGGVLYEEQTVRLVGVNTPEQGIAGATTAKDFLQKTCLPTNYYNLTKKIENNETLTQEEQTLKTTYDNIFSKIKQNQTLTPVESNLLHQRILHINIDDKKQKDIYGRVLAVLIVQERNINEVLLNEGLAEIMYIPPSEFNPYEWASYKMQLLHINKTPSKLAKLAQYFNSDMTNVVFTPTDDPTLLYKYEIYKGIYYIRLNKYPFNKKVRLHILPKSYDCSSKVLIFRDNMLTETNRTLSDDYAYYPEHGYINSYYQENGKDRDRNNISINDRNWDIEDWTNTYCEFSYNISKSTKNFDKLEICAGYRYNYTNPYYAIHYTGVRDLTNISNEKKMTLIDANFDNIETKTNNITKMKYNNKYYVTKSPESARQLNIKNAYGDIPHTLVNEQENINNINKLYHKKIKYMRDDIYVEESGCNGFATWE